MENNEITTDRMIRGALRALRMGRMIVLVDAEDRENEGDLILGAEFATQETINFMIRYGRGLVCLALPPEQIEHLKLEPMSPVNTSRHGTAFTVSIEARDGISTGISAADRAVTIQTAIASDAVAEDLSRPGHVFPIRAREGGVLERAGHTEAALELMIRGGLTHAAVLCEVMNEDGTMAKGPELEQFCRLHRLPRLAICDLVRYLMLEASREQTVSV